MIYKKLVLKLKWAIVDLRLSLGFSPKIKSEIGKVVFLVFHGVCRDSEKFINGRFIKETHFSTLIQNIKTHFHVIGIKEYQAGNYDKNRLNIVLTFDDGYLNNKEIAWPICKKEQVPFTLFMTNQSYLLMDLIDICTSYDLPLLHRAKQIHLETQTLENQQFKEWCINQNQEKVRAIADFIMRELSQELRDSKANFWKLLNDEDLKELDSDALVSLANHGANHLNSKILSHSELLEQWILTDNRLKGFKSFIPSCFAYPYGLYSDETNQILSEMGVQYLFSADGNPKKKGVQIDRLVVNPYISVANQLIAISNGKY